MIQDKYDLVFREPKQNNQWGKTQRKAKAASKSNEMPPGEDIASQFGEVNNMPFSMAGETDVSNNVNPKTMGMGYGKLPMSQTEDMYTNEHQSFFYDDVGGFVERGNVLDRE